MTRVRPIGRRSAYRLAALALAASVLGACSSAPAYPGTVFKGDGYSISVPSDLGLAKVEGQDFWSAMNGTHPVAIAVLHVTDLLPAEQSLEGLRAKVQDTAVRGLFATSPTQTTVSLPAGATYRLEGLTATNPMILYLLYRSGVGYAISIEGFPSGLADQVMQTFR